MIHIKSQIIQVFAQVIDILIIFGVPINLKIYNIFIEYDITNLHFWKGWIWIKNNEYVARRENGFLDKKIKIS